MSQTYNTVLAVDDDPILLQVLAAFFAKHGTTSVLTAKNGVEAVGLYNANPGISLIITDLHMPDGNGVEFLDKLKQEECQAPIVIVSSADERAVSAAGVLANAYQLNFLGSLAKPVNFAELEALLEL